jgi:hypothetical protein
MPHPTSKSGVQGTSTSKAPASKVPASKVRTSQTLSLKPKIKYWNMSMPQSKTSGSGTQHYKHREPTAVIDLTGDESSDASKSDHTTQLFDIKQKAKDKCDSMFNKFSGPMAPASKRFGKQNWSFGALEAESGSASSNTSKSTSEQKQSSVTGPVPGEGESSTGSVKSIFGPRKQALKGEVNGPSAPAAQVVTANNADEAAFRNFTKLPREIRDEIWKLTFPPPQVVTISKDDNEIKKIRKARPKRDVSTIYRAKATYDVPPILHACQESRVVGLNRYGLAFKEQLGGRPAYFNYKNDILLFDSFIALNHFYGGTLINMSSPATGFCYDMNEVHRNVQQVAISPGSQGPLHIIGWTLNLFTKSKLVLIGDGGLGSIINRQYLMSRIEGHSVLKNVWSDLITLKSEESGNLPKVFVVECGLISNDAAWVNTRSVRAILKSRGHLW